MFLPFQKDTEGKLKSTAPIRWCNCSCLKFLDMNFERYKFLESDMNLYFSLATYKDFPVFSFSWRLKSQQQSIWLKEFKKYIVQYFCFIETDCPDIDIAHKDSKDIKTFLDKYKIVYSPKFSLAGDTPILIKVNNEIKLVEIKKAINYINFAEVLTLEKDNKIGWKKITNFISHKDMLINIFVEQNGQIPIQCTKDHSAFVLDEEYNIIEKKGSDLKVGNYLITINNPIDEIIKDTVVEIDFEYTFRKRTKNIGIKKEKIQITNELMWCLGAYLGDGSVSNWAIHIGKSNFQLIKRFGSFFKKQYYHYQKKKRYKTLLYVAINSKKWRDFFEYCCGHLAENKHLPPFIWQVSKDKIYSFLQGYIDTDGCKTEKYVVNIKTKSKKIIRELCWLLKLIGISCRINKEFCKDHPNPTGKNIKGGWIYIIGINKQEFKNKIEKYSKDKPKFSPVSIDNCLPTTIFRKLLKLIKPKIIGGAKGKRPDNMIKNKKTLSRDFLKMYLNWIEKNNKNKTKEVNNLIKKIKKILYSDIRITQIKKINYNKTFSTVYDISVEETERFYTGNYPLLWLNSGSKGFHFIIPPEEFDWLDWKVYDDDAEKNVRSFDQLLMSLPCGLTGEVGNIHLDKVLLFKIIALRMKTLLSCDSIDTSVQDIKRVCKSGYSWDVKSNLIAYPLDDQMFENFSKSIVTPEKVLSYNNYKRGLLWRNTDVPKDERQKLCRQMLIDLGILR
jgi:intein/homing endonuclease